VPAVASGPPPGGSPATDDDRRAPTLAIPPAAYRRHRRNFDRGHHDWIVDNTAATLAQLGDDAGPHRWGPGVLVRLGSVLARRQHLAAARLELTRALDALPDSLARRDLGGGDIHELHLVEVLVTMGEFAEATWRASRLWEPYRHAAIRLGAARALAALHVAGGDLAGAHAWLDEAATRALSQGGDLGLALVHADRATVVAESGRIPEAVTMAAEALVRLGGLRSGAAGTQMLAQAQAAATANAVALAAAQHGDVVAAHQLYAEAVYRATAPDRPVLLAMLDVTRSAILRLNGDVDAITGSQAPVERAVLVLAAAGAEPGRAMAVREQALVAHATGQLASARALAAQSLGLFDRLQMPTESARTRALLDVWDAPEGI
jgi:hypothetical protein